MNIKTTANWIIILLISIALVITTIATNFSKEKHNDAIKIDKFKLNRSELQIIIKEIKNKYPKIIKINNIDYILENKIKNNVLLTLKLKNLGIICTEKEILYTILNASIFKKQNTFSLDLYKKFLQNQKITEGFLQKKIKQTSENIQIKKILKNHAVYKKQPTISQSYIKNTLCKNVLKYNIEKINYISLSKINIIQNINIKSTNYLKFEKEKIAEYTSPKFLKIKYFIINKNIKNKNYITTLISHDEINKNINKIIKRNKFKNKIISLQNNNITYIIKNIKDVSPKLNKQVYKTDIINTYKQKLTHNLLKNKKNLLKKYLNNQNINTKTKIISQRCKKHFFLAQNKAKLQNKKITKLNKNKFIYIKSIYKKQIKVKNKNILENYTNTKIKSKNKINISNKIQTYH